MKIEINKTNKKPNECTVHMLENSYGIVIRNHRYRLRVISCSENMVCSAIDGGKY